MSMYDSLMTDSEIKVRKRWLILTFWTFVVIPFIYYIWAYFKDFGDIQNELKTLKLFAASLLGFSAIKLFYSFVIWNFVYRKCGTKLLTLLLITTPLYSLLSIRYIIKYSSLLSYSAIIVDFCTLPWWIVLSIKMRRINKSIKQRSVSMTD